MPLLDLADGFDEPEPEGEDPDLQTRQQRTLKARVQRFKNRARAAERQMKQCQGDVEQERESWAKSIQENYFTPKFYNAIHFMKESAFGNSDWQRQARERARGVMSLMIQIIRLLVQILTSSPGGSAVSHVLDCVVLDDASCRIKGQGDGKPAIYTVMNTVHTLHVAYEAGTCNNFGIPTAYVCLPSQKTGDLHAAYSSRLLFSSRGLGQAFRTLESKVFGIISQPCELEQRVASPEIWKIQVMVGDAIPTNDAVFRMEREMLYRTRGTEEAKRRLSFRVKCQLHQLCLVRRPAVLSIDKFWTTLVRLAHLFEQYSFKKQFALALIQVLKAPGCIQRSLNIIL